MSKSNDNAGRGKNKRKWTDQEVEATLDFVLELKGDPRWRCDGGFRNGFHQHVEEKLEVFIPGNGLKASQIESKLKFLKEKYITIHEMSKLSGFTWDEEAFMINCEKQAYEDYCKLHPRAKGFWKKPFPFYNKLELIYGQDRATGANCEDVVDMIHNLNEEFVDLDSPSEGADYSSSDAGSRPPLSKRQKIGKSSLGVTGKKDFNDKFIVAIEDFNGHMSRAVDSMVRSDNREELQATQKKMLLSEISMLEGVSEIDAIDATRVISRSPSELDAFFSCPNDHWKKLYVERIIVRLRGSSGASED